MNNAENQHALVFGIQSYMEEICFNVENQYGLIFDIQSYSVHDGPGCRTTVFFSGCPLSCSWCCNPEGMKTKQRLLYRQQMCQHCLRCISACTYHAISLSSHLSLNRQLCDTCQDFACTKVCPHEALKISGKYLSVSDLMTRLQRDRMFWGIGGGVTFSGGEPLLQAAFLSDLLRQCQQRYIHTAMETSACVSTPTFLACLTQVEWAFVDIKHMDAQLHKAKTGVSNELILQNIKALASSPWQGKLIVRIPLIPGYNDTEDNLCATAQFAQQHGIHDINLLPFHRLGFSKYEQLGQSYPCADLASPNVDYMQQRLRWIKKSAPMIRCYIGHETPF